MTPRARWAIAAVIVLGTAIRLVLAFKTRGVVFDIESYEITARKLLASPAHVYEGDRWPYPPGFFPFVLAALEVARLSHLSFAALVRLPMIAADAGIAVLVAWILFRTTGRERAAVAGAALVALGPSFLLISGFHGQLDSVAILPALAGTAVWMFARGPRRAPLAGALVGIGALMKTVPILTALALLPTARSRRERVLLLGIAAAVPALAALPFLVADPMHASRMLRYRGIPGLGGLSLVLQPGLTREWLLRPPPVPTAATAVIWRVCATIAAIALAGVAVELVRRRVEPLAAATMLWLALYAFFPNFFMQYLVWGLPFFVAAGHVGAVAGLQAFLVVPTLIELLIPWRDERVVWVYVPMMAVTWVAFLVAFLAQIRPPTASTHAE